MSYKIFMLIALPALAIGWIAYAIWIKKVTEEEKKMPKQESERLTKTKSEIADWAQQMEKFEKPVHKQSDSNSQD